MRRDGRAYKRDRADGEPKPLQYKNAPDTSDEDEGEMRD